MQRQKRDLAFLLVFQFLAMIFGSVMAHPESSIPKSVALTLMILDLTCLQFLLWKVTAGYAKRRGFKIFYAVLVVFQYVLNAIANGQTPIAENYYVAMVTYPVSLITFSIIFYFIITDMFANKHETTYSLLAASCAYLMIAQLFGYVFASMVLNDTRLIGAPIVTGQDLVRETFNLSHYVVAGFGVPDSVGGMLKNMAVVEAFISNLFIIFVVGRLMASEK